MKILLLTNIFGTTFKWTKNRVKNVMSKEPPKNITIKNLILLFLELKIVKIILTLQVFE